MYVGGDGGICVHVDMGWCECEFVLYLVYFQVTVT